MSLLGFRSAARKSAHADGSPLPLAQCWGLQPVPAVSNDVSPPSCGGIEAVQQSLWPCVSLWVNGVHQSRLWLEGVVSQSQVGSFAKIPYADWTDSFCIFMYYVVQDFVVLSLSRDLGDCCLDGKFLPYGKLATWKT